MVPQWIVYQYRVWGITRHLAQLTNDSRNALEVKSEAATSFLCAVDAALAFRSDPTDPENTSILTFRLQLHKRAIKHWTC